MKPNCLWKSSHRPERKKKTGVHLEYQAIHSSELTWKWVDVFFPRKEDHEILIQPGGELHLAC